jgi:predicted MFS family arabinose efflux permease
MAYSMRALGAALGAVFGGLYGAEAALVVAASGLLLQAVLIPLSPVMRLAQQPSALRSQPRVLSAKSTEVESRFAFRDGS